MKSILIATKADGTQSLIAGPVVCPNKQREQMREFKAQKLTEGVIRVDQYLVDKPFAVAIKIVAVQPAKTEAEPKTKGKK